MIIFKHLDTRPALKVLRRSRASKDPDYKVCATLVSLFLVESGECGHCLRRCAKRLADNQHHVLMKGWDCKKGHSSAHLTIAVACIPLPLG